MHQASSSISRHQIVLWPALATTLLISLAILAFLVRRPDIVLAWFGIALLAVLAVATWTSVRNAVSGNRSIRLFWAVVAGSSGLWALSSLSGLLYGTDANKWFSGPMVAGTILFFHIAMLLAATACRPHAHRTEQGAPGATLNGLLLLSFWIFLYVALVIPVNFPNWDTTTIKSVAIVYSVAAITLTVVAGTLALRTHGPWRPIYLSLCGASAVLAIGSVNSGYHPGLPSVLGIAAACLLVQAAMFGRRLAPGPGQLVLVGPSPRYIEVFAMLMVTVVPLFCVLELLRKNEPGSIHIVRTVAVLAAGLLFTTTAFIREYLRHSRFVRDVNLAHDQLYLAMQSGRSITWDLNLATEEGTWRGDVETFFGIPATSCVLPMQRFYRSIYPQDYSMVAQAISDGLFGAKPFAAVFRIVLPDSTLMWVESHGRFYYNSSGEATRMLGVAVDINQQKQAESALQKNEEEFRLAFEVAHLGWWVWNEETWQISASEGTRTVFGLPAGSEATLQDFLNAIHPEDRERIHRMWRQAVENGDYYFAEYRTVWPDSSIHWVESRGRSYNNPQGKPSQMIGVIVEITERKQAEETLRAVSGRLIAAQEEERVRIARELHDDVCQRLAVISMELVRMKDLPQLSEPGLQGWVDHLAEFTGQIADDLQALSRELHSSKLEILGATATMRSFCARFAEQHSMKIEFTSSNVPVTMSRDASLCLYRILQEGLHNAAKHSRTERLFVELRGERGAVELTVKDSGVGFDPETVAKGHGLGLISMRERVNLVKGTLAIESRPKWGTTIRAKVPVEELNAAQCA